jgi:hypothetical protein
MELGMDDMEPAAATNLAALLARNRFGMCCEENFSSPIIAFVEA